MADPWHVCTECRTEIAFGARYWECSVSTCNRSRLPMFFCSVVCWDAHLSSVRHRDAWAVEARAPSREAWAAQQAAEPAKVEPARAPAAVVSDARETARLRSSTVTGAPPAPIRRVVGDASPASAAAVEGVRLEEVTDKDILVVVSKLKKYIKDRAGMSCSDAVVDVLSDHLRVLCDDAIRAAGRDERKTVLERDVPRPRR